MISDFTTPHQWFHEAAQCYIERHQGCPWCHGSHCLAKRVRGTLVEYNCLYCDFQARHDMETDDYFSIPGEDLRDRATDTLLEI